MVDAKIIRVCLSFNASFNENRIRYRYNVWVSLRLIVRINISLKNMGTQVYIEDVLITLIKTTFILIYGLVIWELSMPNLWPILPWLLYIDFDLSNVVTVPTYTTVRFNLKLKFSSIFNNWMLRKRSAFRAYNCFADRKVLFWQLANMAEMMSNN